MEIARTQKQLNAHIKALRQQGKKIGFVPTMGALHEGHLSLVETARKNSDAIIVSIFVNPTQFAPNEDFSKYPRMEEKDLKKLKTANADLVYLPSVKDIYPDGEKADIKVTEKADILCGKFRPGHFDGVASVVKRLFEQVTPDVAVFGEKDYQQLHIIKWLVKNYDIPVQIIGSPIVREKDGLAMSSRNKYLSAEERKVAAELYGVLLWMRDNIYDVIPAKAGIHTRKGASGKVIGMDTSFRWYDTVSITEKAITTLSAKGFKVDYVEIRDAETLEEIKIPPQKPARIFAAAWLGKTRLIDNVEIKKL